MKRLGLFTLCLVMILTYAVLPISLVAAAQTEDRKELIYDYSDYTSNFNVSVSASELLEDLGYVLSDSERAYLDAYCDFELSYARVLNDKIDKTESGNDGELKDVTITASPYVYTVLSGDSVSIIPKNVFILDGNGNEIASMPAVSNGEGYIAEFTDILVDKDCTYRVLYKVDGGIDIASDDFNFVLNFAYDEATKVRAPLDYYYTGNNADLVNTYVKYWQDQRMYDAYLKDLEAFEAADAIYKVEIQKYNKYVEDYSEYQKQKNAYDERFSEYATKLELYNKYVEGLAAAEAQVKNLHLGLTGKASDMKRELYGCFFAPLVDMVVNNKDVITARWKDLEEHIDNSDLAAKNIRAILKPQGGTPYDKLKTTEEKYEFYRTNYKALRDNVLLLTRSLYILYTTDGMKETMHLASTIKQMEDYTEKLVIFISQLIYISESLNDTTSPIVFTDGSGRNHTINDIYFTYRDFETGKDMENVSIHTVIGNCEFAKIKDYNNATPFSVTKADKPAELTEKPPVEPAKVIEPAEPVRPTTVLKPTVVSKPAGMDVAGWDEEKWAEFLNDAEYNALLVAVYSELIDGTLAEREESGAPKNYSPDIYVEKPFDSDSDVTVMFYDLNGTTLLNSITVKKGGAITNAPSPKKDEDLEALYHFDGWVDENGERFSLHYVTEDNVKLTPVFRTEYKEYPVKNGALEVSTTGKLTYLPVTRFVKEIKAKNIPNLKVSAADTTVVFGFSAIKKLESKNVAYLEVHTAGTATSYSYQVLAYDADGRAVDFSSDNLELTVYLPLRNADATVTYTAPDGRRLKATKDAASGSASFKAIVGHAYTLDVTYSVQNIEVGTDQRSPLILSVNNGSNNAAAGTVVNLKVDDYRYYPYYKGKRVEFFYIHNNEKIFITDNSFIMPEGNVQVGVQVTDLFYTVKFVVDGEEISAKADCKFGDAIKAPRTPIKASDGQYDYKFKGWYCNGVKLYDSTTVTEDAVYVAVFDSIPIMQNKSGFNWLRLLFVGGITVAILGLAVLVIFILDKTKLISVKGIFAAIGRLFKGKKSSEKADSNEDSFSESETDGVSQNNTPPCENADEKKQK